jgi:hypothetical protein
MNKQRIFLIGGGMVALMIIFVWLFASNSSPIAPTPVASTLVSDDWDHEFELSGTGPLGLHLFRQELVRHSGKKDVVINDSLEEFLGDPKSTYIFAGDQFILSSDEFKALIREVEHGAHLFLSFHNLQDTVYDYFFNGLYGDWYYNNQLSVATSGENYQLHSIFQTDTVARRWNLFGIQTLLPSDYTVLSEALQTPNFIEIPVDSGKIFLHANPEMFYNYQFLSKNGYRHGQFVLDQLDKDRRVKWLELGRISSAQLDEAGKDGDGTQDDRFLQYIFKHRSLLYALLLSIAGILLYLIFRTKRVLPVIPYLAPNKNRSLAFADTIKAIYFQQHTPYDILVVMWKNFKANVSRQFFIDLPNMEKETEIRLLAEKTGVDVARIRELTKLFDTREAGSIDHAYITRVAKLQRAFYLETGIIQSRLQEKIQRKTFVFRRRILFASLLIPGGIVLVLRGFYLLNQSSGSGILFWPIGVLLLAWGIVTLNRPVLALDNDLLTHYPSYGKKQTYALNELLEVTVSKGSTQFLFSGNRKVRIQHFELSYYDKQSFEQFVAPYLNQKL